MSLSDHDIELLAARVRLHFEPRLRATAYGLALPLARACGSRIKDLRPETKLCELRQWISLSEIPTEKFALSHDIVSLLREISRATSAQTPTRTRLHTGRARRVACGLFEAARRRVFLRELMLRPGRTTFRDWVESRAKVRRRSDAKLAPLSLG